MFWRKKKEEAVKEEVKKDFGIGDVVRVPDPCEYMGVVSAKTATRIRVVSKTYVGWELPGNCELVIEFSSLHGAEALISQNKGLAWLNDVCEISKVLRAAEIIKQS